MKRQQGFSLLEMLVAFSIMASSLAMLYRFMGSSIRHVSDAEQLQRAVVLAESLFASKDFVDEVGWNESGESAGFNWIVRSAPYATGTSKVNFQAVPLYELNLTVTWKEGNAVRLLELSTLRPQRKPLVQGLSK